MLKHLTLALASTVLAWPAAAVAQEADAPPPPMFSHDQEQTFRHTIPEGWETEIYVTDEEGAARAQMILDLYEVL
ncbi:MAG: hypothetical protein AAF618_13520, partial [Pseudomonadota bacterium]